MFRVLRSLNLKTVKLAFRWRRALGHCRLLRLNKLAPRLIISCNSSALLERASAVSKVICFWKYAWPATD